MSLRGILSDFGSADVFQLLAQQAKTGRLEIERAGRVLEVLFIEGSVLRAGEAVARATPNKTVPRILRVFMVSSGRFKQAAGLTPKPDVKRTSHRQPNRHRDATDFAAL